MIRSDEDDGGDRHRCPVCGLLDTTELTNLCNGVSTGYCMSCGAIDGEAVSEQERLHMEHLYRRISSAEPYPPERYTTETRA